MAFRRIRSHVDIVDVVVDSQGSETLTFVSDILSTPEFLLAFLPSQTPCPPSLQ